ncbi:MAG: SpoIIE family protein phosphatase [Oscillatoria sp. PMC 1068.18]|nr:SpoIIE family protein phosphatase [Oscillatoria sp. PMC 1076.18]MEC4989489.1 SpoIIE family protein phosphatase [Oscillatoria sp. PMC 1068.18]
MSQASDRKLKLMVVDDEPDNLDLLYRTFRREFKVFKADGALKALELLDTEGEMAVIISDQRMPLMNGTELLGKTVARFPETIRILLTGYTDVEDLVEAINSGKVFKYITKPWNPEKLKEVVQQAAETYQVLKARTNELRRALRQEELLNAITSAIRESLDYRSMLQTIVNSIGENFQATGGILKAVEEGVFVSDNFLYQKTAIADDEGEAELQVADFDSLMAEVLANCQTQTATQETSSGNDPGDRWYLLAVPLIVQQEPLAVLTLYQRSSVNPWQNADVVLLQAVAEQAALAVSQAKLYQRTKTLAEQMRAELEVARQIQHNLLRQTLPEVTGVRLQASCYPARAVGGDFFEVYLHPQGDVWLAVGDVSGKGVPAALFMASAISILRRELAQETSPEPDVVMQNLNRTMNDDLFSNNCFITMVLARYRPETKELVYANAGHIYPMVWSHRLLVEQQTTTEPETTVTPNYLKTRGVPVGILPNWKAKAGNLTLESGSTFLLTSDGITEATLTKEMKQVSGGTNSDRQSSSSMLNQEGLWQLILQQQNPFDLNHLLTRVREYTNKIQEDDQTILSLEVL